MSLAQCAPRESMDYRSVTSLAVLSQREFSEFARLIESELGLRMPEAKRSMIASRLARRLRDLGFQSYGQYLEHLRKSDVDSEEFQQFIDVITTHKTEFFREPDHFVILRERVLPELLSQRRGLSALRVWSAACSSGEEVYSLAMVLDQWTGKQSRPLDFSILGTDVALDVLRCARVGVYSEQAAQQIPEELRSLYLMRSRDEAKAQIRMIPRLRAKTEFAHLNFMAADWGKRQGRDIIFCRNVLIYFERRLQERIVQRLTDNLVVGGYLFLGHAEGLAPSHPILESMGNCVYRKRTQSGFDVGRASPQGVDR